MGPIGDKEPEEAVNRAGSLSAHSMTTFFSLLSH